MKIIFTIASMLNTALPYFFYSFGILLREGVEALLVIVALIATTRQRGREHQERAIYAGALAAVALSIALAWGVNHIIGDNGGDTLEGALQILAAATLFYVSSWLTSHGQAQRWMTFLDARALSAGESKTPTVAVGFTAFMAVIREGAETIIFFEALMAGATESAEKHAVAAGIGIAGLGLIAIFAVLRKAAHRLPIGEFFGITSVVLYALAVIFIGQGIASLQEAGVIGATFVERVPTIQALGLFPTVQSLTAQGALLLLAGASMVLSQLQREYQALTRGTPPAHLAEPEATRPRP